MTDLAQTTCVLHPERPATARCPQCRRFYCAECITEHDGRLTCASCLRSPDEGEVSTSRVGALPMALLQLALGLILCWGLYYLFGRVLMMIPADFHDGTIWES